MKIISYLVAAALAFFGFVFIAGSQGQILRLVVGVILLGAAAVFVYMISVKPQPSETTVVQKIDLSGDVNLEQIQCQNCQGTLDRDSIEVRGGAIFVNCPYCGASYQFEEEPKW
jgi:Zn finger protein HypA/HybF involved in hydrogenase expression